MLAAEQVLTGGRIRTLRARNETVEAIAVSSGRIVGVGSNADVQALIGPATMVTPLGGRTVIPGIVDLHSHLENMANYHPTITQAHSPEDVWSVVQSLFASTSDGWFYAVCTLPNASWWPTRKQLDSISGSRPAALAFGSGNYMVNSRALALIDDRLVELEGAILETDGGEPTGVVRTKGEDRLKYLLPTDALYNRDSVLRSLKLSMQTLAAHGVTTMHHVVKDRLPVRIYQELERIGEMPVRIGLLLRGIESDMPLASTIALGFHQPFGTEYLTVQGVKASIDGYFPSGTAAFWEPYDDEPDNLGRMRIAPEDVTAFTVNAHCAGLRVALHANGDRATDAALDAFEAALARQPRKDHRHRIEHAGNLCLNDNQLRRIAELGVVPVPNPTFLYEEAPHMPRRLGADRSRHPVNIAAMKRAGASVGVGSDWSGHTEPSPFKGMAAIVNRRSDDGQVWAPEEAVTPYEALTLYTRAGAWVGFEEQLKGSLEPGKLADMVVLAEDPLDCAPSTLADIRPLATMVGGRWSYDTGIATP